MFVPQFTTYLQTLGYSKTSVYMLPNCVNDFLKFTSKTVQEIVSADILVFYEHLQIRPNKRLSGGLSATYIYHHIYALKLFFNWLLAIGEIQQCPISNLDFKQQNANKRHILSLQEIQNLYTTADNYMEKALLGIYYGCGLRRTEGEKLNVQDVDLKQGLLYVREGKGAKSRVVPMGEKILQDLKNYVYVERKNHEKETAFFVNKRGLRLRGALANTILKNMLQRIEIHENISLHNLRHSIASHLLHQGLSMEYVRDFLGHHHLESTQVYLNH